MKIGVFHPHLGIPMLDGLMESVIDGFRKAAEAMAVKIEQDLSEISEALSGTKA